MTVKRSYAKTDKPALLVVSERKFSVPGKDGKEHDFVRLLCDTLSEHFIVSEPASCGSDIWTSLFSRIPSVIVISRTLPDIDAANYARMLRQSSYLYDICFIMLCDELTPSVRSICSENRFSGAVCYSDPVGDAADEIVRIFGEYSCGRKQRAAATIAELLNDKLYFSDTAVETRLIESIRERILTPLGFSYSQKGTRYLEFIILMSVLGVRLDLTSFYEGTADVFRSTPAAVEKAVRYSIEKAWERSNPRIQYMLLGNTVDASKGKPTNAEFIAICARHMNDYIKG